MRRRTLENNNGSSSSLPALPLPNLQLYYHVGRQLRLYGPESFKTSLVDFSGYNRDGYPHLHLIEANLDDTEIGSDSEGDYIIYPEGVIIRTSRTFNNKLINTILINFDYNPLNAYFDLYRYIYDTAGHANSFTGEPRIRYYAGYREDRGVLESSPQLMSLYAYPHIYHCSRSNTSTDNVAFKLFTRYSDEEFGKFKFRSIMIFDIDINYFDPYLDYIR